MIEQFQGNYRWLSNMVRITPFVVDGITYISTENWYQAGKTNDVILKKKISLLTSYESKKFCRNIEIREDWDEVKDNIMYFGLWKKFNQPYFKKLLLETGDVKIQEGNMWNDKYWGVCLKTGIGQNKLGNMIMEIRTRLQSD